MKIAIFQLMLFQVNCYVVYDPEEKEAAIIDPGIIDLQEVDAIDAFLKKNDLKVVAIINTHLHFDHAIGDDTLRDKYGVPVMAHEADKEMAADFRQQVARFHIPLKVGSAEVTHLLEDGERIRIGKGELEVIHLPGHTPGGIGLYDAEDGFLISGDTLFEGSIGRTDLPGGNLARLLESVKKRLYTLPDETVVYPGHGPATTIGREKVANSYVRG